jgi:hypothetical protein
LNNVLTFSNTITNTVGTTTLMLTCGDKETSTALTCVMSNRIIKYAQLEERGAFMHTTGLNDCIMLKNIRQSTAPRKTLRIANIVTFVRSRTLTWI